MLSTCLPSYNFFVFDTTAALVDDIQVDLECTQVKCAGMVSKFFFSSKFFKSIQKTP